MATLKISYVNIRGQTGLQIEKQLQIEEFLKLNKCDILNLQEAHIETDTFSECDYIVSNYSLISNNSSNKYGTACLVKSDLVVEDVMLDTEGRVIVFEIAGVTFGNVYLPSGTDGATRTRRENYCAQTIPQILVNRKESGCVGGDFNCITNKIDCTSHPDAKMSASLARLVRAFDWLDSFRFLHPSSVSFSRYYEARGSPGATRIDRQYHWGNVVPVSAEYTPLAFSDHLAHSVTVSVPDPLTRMLSPRNRPQFKVREEVARDREFQLRVKVAMERWEEIWKGGGCLSCLGGRSL